MKPLFIPLKTEYYRQFENGTKTHEYRRYGGPWNERTCFVGRLATISRGYSTPDRLRAVVKGFRRIPLDDLPPVAIEAWRKIFGKYKAGLTDEPMSKLSRDIADIELELL